MALRAATRWNTWDRSAAGWTVPRQSTLLSFMPKRLLYRILTIVPLRLCDQTPRGGPQQTAMAVERANRSHDTRTDQLVDALNIAPVWPTAPPPTMDSGTKTFYFLHKVYGGRAVQPAPVTPSSSAWNEVGNPAPRGENSCIEAPNQ
jgi:hypothetical protein